MSYSSAYRFAEAQKCHQLFINSLSVDELIAHVEGLED